MKHLAAYLLATIGGKDKPTEADLKAILASVGAECDSAAAKEVISAIEGKAMSIADLVAAGSKRMAVLSSSAGAAAPAAGAAAPAAAKKEEKSEEEEAVAVNFGGDDSSD